jgi:dTMP kinase
MIKNANPGKFIVFEGLDSAGKSTQTGELVRHFGENCVAKIRATFEPTQLLVGGLVRARLLGEWQSTPECLQLLFAADRAEHLKKEILPLLERGINVVGDRYFLSSVAYGAIDCDPEWLAQINSRFLAPDLTIFLNVPPAVCAQRIAANGRSIELFEKSDILEKVKTNYLDAIARFGKEMDIVALDGTLSVPEVAADVIKLVNGKIFCTKK